MELSSTASQVLARWLKPLVSSQVKMVAVLQDLLMIHRLSGYLLHRGLPLMAHAQCWLPLQCFPSILASLQLTM